MVKIDGTRQRGCLKKTRLDLEGFACPVRMLRVRINGDAESSGNWAASHTLFSYKNLCSMAREFSRKCEMLRCENSTLAMICLLLLINDIDVTIL